MRQRSNSRRVRYNARQQCDRARYVYLRAMDPQRWLEHTLWIVAAGGLVNERWWKTLSDVRYGLHITKRGKLAWRDAR